MRPKRRKRHVTAYGSKQVLIQTRDTGEHLRDVAACQRVMAGDKEFGARGESWEPIASVQHVLHMNNDRKDFAIKDIFIIMRRIRRQTQPSTLGQNAHSLKRAGMPADPMHSYALCDLCILIMKDHPAAIEPLNCLSDVIAGKRHSQSVMAPARASGISHLCGLHMQRRVGKQMQPARVIVMQMGAKGGFILIDLIKEHTVGAGCYAQTGEAFLRNTLDRARAADAILLSAMGLPGIRYPNGTKITLQIDLRIKLDLYAGLSNAPASEGGGGGGFCADPRKNRRAVSDPSQRGAQVAPRPPGRRAEHVGRFVAGP